MLLRLIVATHRPLLRPQVSISYTLRRYDMMSFDGYRHCHCQRHCRYHHHRYHYYC